MIIRTCKRILCHFISCNNLQHGMYVCIKLACCNLLIKTIRKETRGGALRYLTVRQSKQLSIKGGWSTI